MDLPMDWSVVQRILVERLGLAPENATPDVLSAALADIQAQGVR
jgi:hypothetical protein